MGNREGPYGCGDAEGQKGDRAQGGAVVEAEKGDEEFEWRVRHVIVS